MYANLVDTTDKAGKIKAVRFFDDPGATMFRDWENAFNSHLNPLKGIQSYHFFRFTAITPGIVEVKRLPQDEWTKIDLRKGKFLLANFLDIEPCGLLDTGLNPEKRHDLWSKYSPYVPSQYQDSWYYSKPADTLISTVREKKNTRAAIAKEAKQGLTKNLDQAESSKVQTSLVTPPAKRGRGRPPGSKNKRKAADQS